MKVVDLKPKDAVLIIETDMNVEFAPPKDNDEYEKKLERLKAERAAIKAAEEAKKGGSGGVSSGTGSSSGTVGGWKIQADANGVIGGTSGTPSTLSSTSPESKNDGSSGKSNYFEKLGRGRSLKEDDNSSSTPSYSANDRASAWGRPSPSSTSSSSSTSVNGSEGGTSTATALKQEVVGNFIYYRDDKGKLVKRVPVTNKSFVPFSNSTGHSLR